MKEQIKKEIPILMSTPMVAAILAGRKSMTRRIIKPPPVMMELPKDKEVYANVSSFGYVWHERDNDIPAGYLELCPYGKQGDVLFVRETFCYGDHPDSVTQYIVMKDGGQIYKTGEYYPPCESYAPNAFKGIKWRPSIHLPKWGSRIWLEVTDIKVERLQDITEEDAIAEGVEPNCKGDDCPSTYCAVNGCQAKGEYFKYGGDLDDFPAFSAKESFESLWIMINGEESFNQNTWLWVVSFKVLSTTGKPK